MARVLMMTDFSESYANKLLQGIERYSHEHSPWVVSKVPLSLRDSNKMDAVADIATYWKADAIIGQFRSIEDIRVFSERGIIPIAQDYIQPFPGIINITGDYELSGRAAARYYIDKGLRNFAFYGMKGVIWSDSRRDGFLAEIESALGTPVPKKNLRERREMKGTWWYSTDHLINWLRNLPKPVGIFACDDNKAHNIIEACALAEDPSISIPEQIMVLGVDNDETLGLLCQPKLSSLALDVESAGYQLAGLIEALLKLPLYEREEAYKDIIVKHTHIVSRQSTEIPEVKNPFINRVVHYIQDNLSNGVGVKELVELAPMSRRTLEETFLREMGSSIYQYIIQERVRRAKEMMDRGLKPQQAALELGLEYKVMARNFKKVTGVSPKDYTPPKKD